MPTETPTRHAFKHANYSGNQTHAIGSVMGPNLLGEHMVVVAADYDTDADTTRLGFAFATTDDMLAVSR
jgi:hypothetical protein